jgi:hypothetical protein
LGVLGKTPYLTTKEIGMATIAAASASYAHVAAAIALASAGDSVTFPAGSATWNSRLEITTGINLIGAGIGVTNITSGYTGTGDYFDKTNYLISYLPTASLDETFRLSGFTLDCDSLCGAIFLENTTTTPITKIRVDHVRVVNAGGYGGVNLMVYGHIYGVADNNVFPVFTTRFFGLNSGTWSNFNYVYGSADQFYLEDNTLGIASGGDNIYLEGGGRVGLRYNTITQTIDTSGGIINSHGNQGNANHAAMGCEAYENTYAAGTYWNIPLSVNGGKALFYNNAITTTNDTDLIVNEETFDSENLPANSPNGQPQHISDTYIFNNTRNTTTIYNAYFPYNKAFSLDYGGATGVVPRNDVHYWKQVSSFDGTTGVGVGLLAARPATCTTGVGYWATDTSILYRAVATNTWEAYYAPYTYPHPLRGEGVAPNVMTVTSPNGGESWAGNSEHNITWTNTGDTVYANVKIQYSADSGVTWTNISASTANTGSYAWTVPNSAAGTYMIKVSAVV